MQGHSLARSVASCARALINIRTWDTNCWTSRYPTRPVPSTYRKPTVTAAERETGNGIQPGGQGSSGLMACFGLCDQDLRPPCLFQPACSTCKHRHSPVLEERNSADSRKAKATRQLVHTAAGRRRWQQVLGRCLAQSGQAWLFPHCTTAAPVACASWCPLLPLTQVEHKLEAVVGAAEEGEVDAGAKQDEHPGEQELEGEEQQYCAGEG